MTLTETVPAALERAASDFGDLEAVVDRGDRWTFTQLYAESLRVARALIASGVRPGDRVALWSPNSARWIATSFGVYAAGAVLVPVNTRFKGMEAAHVLGRSGASVLLGCTDAVGTDLLALLEGAGDLPALREVVVVEGPEHAGAVDWEDFVVRGAAGERPLPAVDADDLADIIFTSGTTGAPKGAMLGHGPSVRTYEAWSDAVGLQRGDRYLCVYPFFHTAGLKSAVLACVLRGATVLPHAVFDAGVVMQRVSQERITVLPGPPTVFQAMLEHPERASFDLSSLR
ncbi:MAG TPA: AMP-binding protein, partial [Acidimicrobiales bacterium]|nr:AMP-binding protein [Acidimicrobiales bacterium]